VIEEQEMSKGNTDRRVANCKLKFRKKAVRLFNGGQAVPVKSKIPGVPTQTLTDGSCSSSAGQTQKSISTIE
jgi:hypothetical protein